MSNARILIVEDEYLVAADLEAALEDRGFVSVGVAQDQESAERLAQAHPDVALVDVHLRDGVTGPLIGRRLAEQFGVKVLFVTANPAMVADAAGPGVVGVIGKPCRDALIAAALDYALETPPPMAPPAGLTLLAATA